STLPAGACATYHYTYSLTNATEGDTYDFSVDVKEFVCENDISVGTGDIVHMMYDYDGNGTAEYVWCAREMVSGTGTGRTWLDRNLGAYQRATAVDDHLSYGDLYQWGRPMDGHHKINWTSSTVGTPANAMLYDADNWSDTPNDVRFFEGDDDPSTQNNDWVDNNNNNRWQTTPQGPCPTGYHVPTDQDWFAEYGNLEDIGDGDPYGELALPHAGSRSYLFGTVSAWGGAYWGSSNIYQDRLSPALRFTSSTGSMNIYARASGFSVRCIKD
ncbi:MAG: hypothetical protein GY712_03730, partial [Oceanicoccus sp.]|uniref:hypothetical protein n=1 Tax=Oceanicoccus sp. TaxID=2691044 RepID=UPI002622AB44